MLFLTRACDACDKKHHCCCVPCPLLACFRTPDNGDGRVLRGAHPLLRFITVPVWRLGAGGCMAINHEFDGEIVMHAVVVQ